MFIKELNNYYYNGQEQQETLIFQTKQQKLQTSQISVSSSIISQYNYSVCKVDLAENKYLTNLEGITQLPYLKELSLANCMINNLEFIIQLKKLVYLNISGTRINIFNGFSQLLNLQILLCTNIKASISHEQKNILLTEINNMNNLLNVNIAGNHLSSIQTLQNYKIQSLNIANNSIQDISSIQSYIQQNTALKHLDISNNIQLDGELNLQNSIQLEYIGNNNNNVILHNLSHIKYVQIARNTIASDICQDIISLNISETSLSDQQFYLLLQRLVNLQDLNITTSANLHEITVINQLYTLKKLVIDNNQQLNLEQLHKLKLNTLYHLSIRHCNLQCLDFLSNPSFYQLQYLDISFNDKIAIQPLQLIYLLYLNKLKQISCIQSFGQIKIRQYIVYFLSQSVEQIVIYQNYTFSLAQLKKINFKQNKVIKLQLPAKYQNIYYQILQNLSKQIQQQSFLSMINQKTQFNFNYIPKSEQYKVTKIGKVLYKISINNIDIQNSLIYKNKYTKHDIDFYTDMSYRNKHYIIDINNNGSFTSCSQLFQFKYVQEIKATNCQNLYEPFDKYMQLMFTHPQKILQNIAFIDQLTTLNMHGSKVRLDTFVFIICTFKWLKYIDLSNNQLDYIQLQTMDKHFLNKIIKKLQSLNPQSGKNNISKIPKNFICNINQLRQLQSFNVANNYNMQLELIADELQALHHINVENTNLQLLKLNSDQKITQLNISRNKSLIYNAVNLLLLRQMKQLDISSIQSIDVELLNTLEITDDDRKQCNNKLLKLSLNNVNCCPLFLNYFSTITELHMQSNIMLRQYNIYDIIRTNINIQMLDISNNDISLETLDLLFLPQLKCLNIANNNIKSIKVNRQVLETLDISNNQNFDFLVLLQLSYIKSLACNNLQLQKQHTIIRYNRFNLKTNQIDKMQKTILSSYEIIKKLTTLRHLSMSYCDISQQYVKNYDLRTLLSLETLNLNHSAFNFNQHPIRQQNNQVTTNQYEQTTNYYYSMNTTDINVIFLSRSILSLNLSTLGLKTFSNIIQHCYNLKILNISWNNLHNVYELYCLKNLKFLNELYMQGNNFYDEEVYNKSNQQDNVIQDKQHNEKSVQNNKLPFKDLFNTNSESKAKFLKILFYSITINLQKLQFDNSAPIYVFNQETMLAIKDLVQNIYFNASGLVTEPYYIKAYKQQDINQQL